MSMNAASADTWIADLEDILGLSSVEGQEPGAGRKQPDEPARSSLVYVTVLVLGLAALVVGVARTNSSPNIGDRPPGNGQSAPASRRPVRLDPPRMTAGIDAVPASNAGRGAGPAVIRLMKTDEKPPILASEAIDTRWRAARPASLQGEDQTSRAGNDVNAGGKAVASLISGAVGRKIAAASDPASPGLNPSRGTSFPDAKLAVDDARLASAPSSPLRPSGMISSVPVQLDKMSSDEAGRTLAPASPEKTAPKKTGAIDALRMLRRQ